MNFEYMVNEILFTKHLERTLKFPYYFHFQIFIFYPSTINYKNKSKKHLYKSIENCSSARKFSDNLKIWHNLKYYFIIIWL